MEQHLKQNWCLFKSKSDLKQHVSARSRARSWKAVHSLGIITREPSKSLRQMLAQSLFLLRSTQDWGFVWVRGSGFGTKVMKKMTKFPIYTSFSNATKHFSQVNKAGLPGLPKFTVLLLANGEMAAQEVSFLSGLWRSSQQQALGWTPDLCRMVTIWIKAQS